MATTDRLVRWSGARLSRRMVRAAPWVGTAIALVTIGAAMKRKGFFRGAVDTGLNAIPFVGSTKTAIEFARGRDFFPDRVPTPRR